MISVRAPRLVRLFGAMSVVSLLALSAAPRSASADEPKADAKAAPTGPSTTEIASKIQTVYNETKSFSATFNQVYKVRAHGTTKKSAGRVIFSKPGKMSWTYDAPNGNRVVSDGKLLKVFEKENNQYFEQSVEKSQYPAALSFLMGEGDLTKSFELKALDAATLKFEGGYVLEGTPKEETPAYRKVIFYVDSSTSQVRRVVIVDAQGNQNRFDFSAPKVNESVDEKTFAFTPPDGVQTVKPLSKRRSVDGRASSRGGARFCVFGRENQPAQRVRLLDGAVRWYHLCERFAHEASGCPGPSARVFR